MNLNQQIEDWLTTRKESFQSENRPFVTLSYAQSWDGSITTRRGQTVALSGADSKCLTHQLRSLHDGLLVGIETVMSDDPQLTVRDWQGENPQPIVLDTLIRMPESARLCQHPDKQCWILTTRSHSDTEYSGAEIITLKDTGTESVPLDSALQLLLERGIKSLMVEGGATVISAFLRARLVDALVMTVAPVLLGGYKAINDLVTTTSNEQLHIDPLFTERLGNDLIVWGDIRYGIRS
ncbi:MAG: RibD family protein [Deltaproteobacteria bacterium]|jgi:riboflavin-specific deaminase-like protein|nr:RibD family protein [Deltaproteobacteria bacterium]